MSIFSKIRLKSPSYSKFNLSHNRKMTANIGELTPMFLQEVLPGDKYQVNSEIMLRFSPLIAPIMHKIDVYTHYFFVPNRLIFDKWQEFITGGKDGDSTVNHPKIILDTDTKEYTAPGSLMDYLGIPDLSAASFLGETHAISELPFRAYQLIYSEYYRDPNLEEEVAINTTEQNTDPTLYDEMLLKLRHRSYEKDYFSSALPYPQRGQEVEIPIAGSFSPQYLQYTSVKDGEGQVPDQSGRVEMNLPNSQTELNDDSRSTPIRLENLVDPQQVDGVTTTVNDLRKSIKLQEWLEKNARAGYRYTEQILAHFGVRSSDARLQRPEYLGGGKQPVVISEVLSTFGNDTDPQGEMSGHGISVGKTNYFKRSFEEHGYIIGIMSVVPKPSYYQGLHRMWKRFDRFDYYWPEFAHLGEQAIKTEEIWCNTEGHDGDTFGYTSRYAEYRSAFDSIHGDFKSTLDFWHMARKFESSIPLVLNESTFKVRPEAFDRVWAVATEDNEDKMYLQVFNKVKALRKIPYFTDPKI